MAAYHQPQTLAQALALLADNPRLRILAGATDIYPAKTARAGWGAMTHPDILDISALRGLCGIAEAAQHWRIGATTTWSEILATDLPPLFDGLKAAAREIGGVQIQNRGTIAGNICTASPAGDSIPCLLALDAEVETASADGVRRVALADFIVGYRHTSLAGNAIVTGVCIPRQGGIGKFIKLGARRYLVISIAMVAGVVEYAADGTIAAAAIAVGACSAVAQRLPALEAALLGRKPDPAVVIEMHLASLQPIDDVRASAAYRQAAALQLVRDLVAAYARPERRAA